MLELTPQDPHQPGYDREANRLIVAAGETVHVLFKGSRPGAAVSSDDLTVATVAGAIESEPARLDVLGVGAGRTTLRATCPGEAAAELVVVVGPHARFVRSASDDGRVDDLTFELQTTATVTLECGDDLAVAPADPSLIVISETASVGRYRVFNVSAVALGSTALQATSTTGEVLAALNIHVMLSQGEPNYSCVGPSYQGDHCFIPSGLGDVPSDLMAAADGDKIDFAEADRTPWTNAQAQFAFKVFLHAVTELASRSMPRRSAVLLTAQTDHENSLGTQGPNVDPRFKNYFAYQPGTFKTRTVNHKAELYLPDDDPEILALKRVGVSYSMEPRGNDVNGSSTPTPHYAHIAQCIACQLDIALPMRFARLGEVVRDPKATGEQFAERAAAAGYGFGYRENYPGEYRTTLKFLKKALKSVDLSVEAKTWCSRMVLQL